ncbi:MAG: acetate uptake transporter [Coriobacteriia bacterium]|nr:acetate uptake transporter [Coriobacteriia bacterium]
MENKLGNPAVVGLAGFGLTTFTLQLFNLHIITLAPVIWLGIVFGGGCQLIAGLMEFKTGNNFGFMAFTGYGAFWISLALLLGFGTSPVMGKVFPVLAMGPTDLGWFLVGWTIFTAILFVGAMRHNTMLALVFLTLLLGFIGLDVAELGKMAAAGTFAAYDLIICAFCALYLGASTALADSGINLPVGGPWMS